MFIVHKLLTLYSMFLCCGLAHAQPPALAAAGGPKRLQGCEIIARIDDQVVLASDVMWEVNLILADNVDRIPPEQIEATRDALMQKQLKSYIDTKLIYADFRRKARGADMDSIRKQLDDPFFNGGTSGKSPGSVPGLMGALQTQNVDDLDRKLVELGTSLVDRKEAYIEKAVAQTWLQEQVSIDKPDYADLYEYYQDHLDEYSYPTQARWEELTIRFANHPDKQVARQRLAEAGNQVWQLVQQKPDSTKPLFGDVAKKYSEALTAKQGGLHSWTTQGALRDQVLDQALFTLPVGSLSPILESDSGLHIVRVVERRQAGHTPFTEVQESIRKKMMNQDFQAKTEELIGKFRRETRIWTIYTGDTTAEAFLASPVAPRRR